MKSLPTIFHTTTFSGGRLLGHWRSRPIAIVISGNGSRRSGTLNAQRVGRRSVTVAVSMALCKDVGEADGGGGEAPATPEPCLTSARPPAVLSSLTFAGSARARIPTRGGRSRARGTARE